MQLYLSSGVRTNIRIAAAVGLADILPCIIRRATLGKSPMRGRRKGAGVVIMSDLALLVRLVSLRVLGRL